MFSYVIRSISPQTDGSFEVIWPKRGRKATQTIVVVVIVKFGDGCEPHCCIGNILKGRNVNSTTTSSITMSTASSDATNCAVPYAATALALTVQDWTRIGLDEALDLEGEPLLNSLTERLTSLLLVRAVAVITPDSSCFPDLSTSSICRTVLVQDNPWSYYAPGVTQEFIDQLYSFVRTILSGYHHTPYHCSEHAFHVSCSVHKLLDLLLHTDPDVCKTFGIHNDPLAHWSVLFAALIHDVEHKGVPNRQLVVENDPLAVLYNDESVAEQRSLFIGFDQFLRPEFSVMREALFGGPEEAAGAESYRRFRKLVIGLVLSTDIASPERTQLGKSKWKEGMYSQKKKTKGLVLTGIFCSQHSEIHSNRLSASSRRGSVKMQFLPMMTLSTMTMEVCPVLRAHPKMKVTRAKPVSAIKL